MNIIENESKTILRKQKKIDSWFISRYGMNLYRGCSHNCVYCDGRHDKYQVVGNFGKDVVVKSNALEILQRELDPKRKRSPMDSGFFLVGGGVGDSYQPAEKKMQLTKYTLELMLKYGHPVHMLTKSNTIERDIETIKAINNQKGALVSFSFSGVDTKLSRKIEPGASGPIQKLNAISRFKDAGIPAGMFLMPVIPFLTDTEEAIEASIASAKASGADYIIFSGMTLKPGKQKDYFLNWLNLQFPYWNDQYQKIYHGDKWGNTSHDYYEEISLRFFRLANHYKMPVRIPQKYFQHLLSPNDFIVVMLEQLDYQCQMLKIKSPYGYAAYAVSKLSTPIQEVKDLTTIKGVGSVTQKIIKELLTTGNSSYYTKLCCQIN